MKWSIKPKAPEKFLKQFPEFPPLIAQLLFNRNLVNQAKIDEFFNSDYEADIHDPFLLKDMAKAVKRIIQALRNKEKITVYGDFDADGICSTVIMFSVLKSLGAKELNVYIPDREKENHGLNQTSLEFLAKSKTNLIITVDCGVTDIKEVEIAKKLGLDVIITDHHEPGKKLPKAAAVINSLRQGDKYPFKDLSGAGVSYKLSCALLRKERGEKNLEKWLLDLTALATVADVMPLLGENRTLVKYGLGVLAQTKRVGLQELMKAAGVQPTVVQHSVNGEPPATNLNTYTLGFVLGPRINSASRIDHADIAFQLLTAEDREKAKRIAQDLNKKNTQRQTLVDDIVRQLKERVNSQSQEKLIFEGKGDWPVGVLGLAASKLVDQYHRPCFIFNKTNKGEIHCSGRSIPQFDMIKAIYQCSKFLNDFGGHCGAAGARLQPEQLDGFKKCLLKAADRELSEKDLAAELEIDVEISWPEISWDNYDQLQNFAPFGEGNPEPVFLLQSALVNDFRVVGNNGKHLKITLSSLNGNSQNQKIKAIGFNLADWADKIKAGDVVDVVFKLIIDEWNDQRDLQMKIIDLKPSEFQLNR